MDLSQGLTSFFRSPEVAQIAAIGVQAAEQAARQGLASIHRDAQHREHQVNAMNASLRSAAVGQRHGPEDREEHRKRRQAAPGASRGPAAWPAHRLDITV